MQAGFYRGCLVTLAAATGGALLAGCGASAGSVAAHQACGYVAKAETLQREADSASGSRAVALAAQAERQLELGEPFAATAAGGGGNWQALQANLAETNSLPASMILPGARADCSYNGY